MVDPPGEYEEFIRRIRLGDESAAGHLVRLYEPEIRLEVRSSLRFRDPRIRRVLDSMDISQSVMCDFFVRAALGDFDLTDPSKLVRLLSGMARNKLAEHVRFHQTRKRDIRVVEALEHSTSGALETPEMPSRAASARDLLERCRALLSDRERILVDMRARGDDWATIAAATGGSAEARRKQFARVIARVATQLGFDPTIG